MNERRCGSRPSDTRVYTHRLDTGTPVWSLPESEIETEPTRTSIPWHVHVRGADRRDAASVPARIGRIIGAREDQGFKPGDTVYVLQETLLRRTAERSLLRELDLPEAGEFHIKTTFQQPYLPGFERKVYEQGSSDFTDYRQK